MIAHSSPRADSVRALADRYIELLNAKGEVSMAELYEDDAQLLAPQGQRFRGREAIAEFYRWDVVQIARTMRMGLFLGEGGACAFELHVARVGEEFGLQAMVHMTTGVTGRLVRHAVYLGAPAHVARYDRST